MCVGGEELGALFRVGAIFNRPEERLLLRQDDAPVAGGLQYLADALVSGLDQGADDYIPKPFSPKVLIARLKAVLRRKGDTGESSEDLETIVIHELKIDSGRHEVQVKGEEVKLTMTEFSILALLASRPGWVFSRQQIIDAVRGYDYMVTPRAIDVQIFGLRKKLKSAGGYIETVRGIGYRFVDE